MNNCNGGYNDARFDFSQCDFQIMAAKRGAVAAGYGGFRVPLWVTTALVASFLAVSCTVTILNKWLIDGPLRAPSLITFNNQSWNWVLSIACIAAVPRTWYQPTYLRNLGRGDLFAVVMVAIGYVLNVGGRNLSLLWFSLALTQLVRAAVPVIVAVASFLIESRRFTRFQVPTFVVLLVGIFLGAVGSADFSLGLGFLFALGSAFGSATMIVSTGYLTYSVPGLHPLDLIFWSTPFAAVVMLIVGWQMDEFSATQKSVEQRGWVFVIGILAVTGSTAFSFSIVVFFIIKVTSSVYYSVTGGVRFVVVVGFSFLLFDQPINTVGIIGVAIASVGFLANSVAEYVVGSPATKTREVDDVEKTSWETQGDRETRGRGDRISVATPLLSDEKASRNTRGGVADANGTS